MSACPRLFADSRSSGIGFTEAPGKKTVGSAQHRELSSALPMTCNFPFY